MRLKADQECFQCDYCGTVEVPAVNAEGIRVFDEPAKVQCPVCEIPMVEASAAGSRIVYCNHCHGILVSMEAFPGVVQDLKAHREGVAFTARPFDPRDLDRRLPCPRCGRRMDTHLYGGGGNVIIDACESCQLNWLDHGELDRIVRAPDREYAG